MLGKRSPQLGLFEADHLYLDFVGRDTFYGMLASLRGQLFGDEDFAELYCLDNGRPSVPPSVLATALLLQTYDGVADEEATGRATYDVRWKTALGIEIREQPFAKSTLQLFRAKLILNDRARRIFERSLKFAQESGYFKAPAMRVALDTTNILGRGAVKDTYNLLADGIRQLLCALAETTGQSVTDWARAHELDRYLASSLKGTADMAWDDPEARRGFLHEIVQDANRVLALSTAAQVSLLPNAGARETLQTAGYLLQQLITQDVDCGAGPAQLKRSVARDRVVSVHDPEMRHGRKSHAKRFDGHKAAIAVDVESQLITAVDVLPGNAADDTNALGLVEASEAHTGVNVSETLGDCAYGSGATRQAFADDERILIAPVVSRRRADQLSKDDFQIDLEHGTCTCPAAQVTCQLTILGYHSPRNGTKQPLRGFVFDPVRCAACRLHSQCVKAKQRTERIVRLHPQERLLQAARALQDSPESRQYRKDRQVAEHRLARLVQLGIRQARYFGRRKTLFQLLLAATVANLTLTATKSGLMKGPKRPCFLFLSAILADIDHIWSHLAPRSRNLCANTTNSTAIQSVFG
jgi:hypothetical protein